MAQEIFLLQHIRKDKKNTLEQFFVGLILGSWILIKGNEADIGILFTQFDDVRIPVGIVAILIGFVWYGVYCWIKNRDSFSGWRAYEILESLFAVLLGTLKNTAITVSGTIFICSLNSNFFISIPLIFSLMVFANHIQKTLNNM